MGRPKTPLLDQVRIADAAIELVDETGDVQIVQLAKRLGVAPSSLYNHVTGREQVIDIARLRMLETMEQPAPVSGWQQSVEQLLRQLVANYLRHPRMLPLIFAQTMEIERTIAIYEPVFVALLEAGFQPRQLRLIIALIESQALGIAQGLPEPILTDALRESLPGYAASIEHSEYNAATATDFAVRVILPSLEQIRTEASAD